MVRSKAIDTSTLVAAAAGVFERKGFRNSTIDDVAEAAGIARATLYRYAESKQHLLDMIVDVILDDMATGLQAALRSDGSPRERLRRYVEAHARLFLENRIFYGIVFTEEREMSDRGKQAFRGWARSVTDDFTHLVQQYLASRDPSTTMDAAFASNAVLSMLSMLYRWYRPGGPVGEGQLADQLFRLVDGALTGAAGCADQAGSAT
jgi:TetR/AcrR family transcriptional regulator, cholesterol catabolism regulator